MSIVRLRRKELQKSRHAFNRKSAFYAKINYVEYPHETPVLTPEHFSQRDTSTIRSATLHFTMYSLPTSCICRPARKCTKKPVRVAVVRARLRLAVSIPIQTPRQQRLLRRPLPKILPYVAATRHPNIRTILDFGREKPQEFFFLVGSSHLR